MTLRVALALGVLLIMAGVELNPGPRQPTSMNRTSSQTQLHVTESGSVGVSTRSTRQTGGDPANQDLTAVLLDIQSKLHNLDKNYTDMSHTYSKLDDKIGQVHSELKTENEQLRRNQSRLEDKLAHVEDKLDRLEGQSKRNNLLFYDCSQDEVPEPWSVSETKVKDYMRDTLSMNTDDIHIERAHRLTRRRNSPIIAKFNDYKQRQSVFEAVNEKRRHDSNWVNPHRVTEDFTQRVRNDRRNLGHYLREAKAQGRRAVLRYNKLIVDGEVYTYDSQHEKVVSARDTQRSHDILLSMSGNDRGINNPTTRANMSTRPRDGNVDSINTGDSQSNYATEPRGTGDRENDNRSEQER
ncbi:MAG: hypothetical protein ABW185_03120 [Sedimenticola sp.]